jgi:hypothetical protein
MRIIHALMGDILDYAGLFPPAKLDMAPTVAHYARYRTGDDRWMLGRLIVPVSRLTEFEEVAEQLLPRRADDAWTLSAICAPASEGRIQFDLERIEQFNDDHADPRQSARFGSATIDTIELAATSAQQIDQVLDALPDHLFPYIELPAAADPRGLIASLAGSEAGAKVRTGGAAPAAYPTPANLARFILACAASEVPFKATAGLHHPLRHRNESVGCDEFGFLNVFIGAALALQGVVNEDSLVAVLQERDAAAFRFGETSISWRRHEIDHRHLLTSRQQFAHAFGSCSFDEPLEGLRALGLLEASPVA